MKKTKSDIGIKIHRAFREMAFAQQQIVHVEVLKKTQQDHLDLGLLSQVEYEKSRVLHEEKSRALLIRLEEKGREVEQLKKLMRQ